MSETKNDFTPVDAGEYLVMMNKVTPKTTAKGDKALSLGFSIIQRVGDTLANESKTKGRLIFEYLLLENASPKAVDIAKEKVDKFLKAIGKDGGLDDIDHDIENRLAEFVQYPLIVKVKVKEGTNGYGPSNQITSFKQR